MYKFNPLEIFFFFLLARHVKLKSNFYEKLLKVNNS